MNYKSVTILASEHENLAEYLSQLERERHRYAFALSESLMLQSHYASLLNQYDGGHRIGFKNNDEWLARLEMLELSKIRTIQ